MAARGTSWGAGRYQLRRRAEPLRDGGNRGTGIAHRAGRASPPLHLLTSWYMIGASALLFGVEFFADKIPAFDLVWNALHTFVRAPAAALLAYRATAQLSPGKQLLAALAGGLIAFAAHGGKTAVRAAVTPSPEPLSNISLSLGEDVFAIFLTWFATKHPYLAGGIVLWLLVVIVVVIRWVLRALSALLGEARRRIAS
ncbi:MAG: DUF4126 domain-containing protein [Acidobacteria bacterium]|nr:MAG: DUF4126 domain-containing protein [Acidobacteriota bacterium]